MPHNILKARVSKKHAAFTEMPLGISALHLFIVVASRRMVMLCALCAYGLLSLAALHLNGLEWDARLATAWHRTGNSSQLCVPHKRSILQANRQGMGACALRLCFQMFSKRTANYNCTHIYTPKHTRVRPSMIALLGHMWTQLGPSFGIANTTNSTCCEWMWPRAYIFAYVSGLARVLCRDNKNAICSPGSHWFWPLEPHHSTRLPNATGDPRANSQSEIEQGLWGEEEQTGPWRTATFRTICVQRVKETAENLSLH